MQALSGNRRYLSARFIVDTTDEGAPVARRTDRVASRVGHITAVAPEQQDIRPMREACAQGTGCATSTDPDQTTRIKLEARES